MLAYLLQVCPQNPGDREVFPPGTFVTCSSDNTIRFWNLNNLESQKRNVFSKEILRTIFLAESDYSTMKARDLPLSLWITLWLLIRVGYESGTPTSEGGIRCIKVHPSGTEIASGDRQGNLRIHSLPSMECIRFEEAHDVEILDLDYSLPSSPGICCTFGSVTLF